MGNSIPTIEHVVVLMFENRSFDHLFGAFPGADGVLAADGSVKPDVYNLDDPTRPEGPDPRNPDAPANRMHVPFPITPDDPLVHDFYHDFVGMMPELFGPGTSGWKAGAPIGAPSPTYPEANSGFYSTMAYNNDPPVLNGKQAMSYYEHGSLKVLHSLASEFVLCDNWFCDAPGDTLLNRFFMHAATANGELSDSQGGQIGQDTLYDRIGEKGSSWKIYAPFAEIDGRIVGNPQIDSRLFSRIVDSPHTNRPVTEFAGDLAGGTLPFYSFLMCWLPPETWKPVHETSMHPISDIRSGENYLAAVYNALRNSLYWDKTLLIVTFDENGGLYDHVPPPVAVSPDGLVGEVYDSNRRLNCVFDFTLLGPRIPALLVSPWLSPGIASGQYQNTSILRFVHDQLGSACLNQRDGNAPGLDGVFAQFGLDQARTDCSSSLPTYQGFPYADGNLSKTYAAPSGPQPMPNYMAELEMIYRHGQQRAADAGSIPPDPPQPGDGRPAVRKPQPDDLSRNRD